MKSAVLPRILGISLFLLFCYNKSQGAPQLEKSAKVRLPAKFSFLKQDAFSNFKDWNYLLYLPDSYRESPEKWPLLIYLHGSSLRGNNLDLLKRYGPPSFLDKRDDFPFVVISPQLPEGEFWEPETLMPLVIETVDKLKIDKYRVYLTGVSMGGGGTWNLAAASQNRFAAIAPICGFGEEEIAPKLNNLPIWAFHGEIDKVTPLGPHQRLVDAVNRAGGNAKMTIIPKGTHGNVIYPTYKRDDLYEWFLSHNRKPKVIAKPIETSNGATPVITGITEPKKKVITKPSVTKPAGYTVKRGDTLWGISKRYGIPVDKLKRVNRLNTTVIQVGQVLTIPKA